MQEAENVAAEEAVQEVEGAGSRQAGAGHSIGPRNQREKKVNTADKTIFCISNYPPLLCSVLHTVKTDFQDTSSCNVQPVISQNYFILVTARFLWSFIIYTTVLYNYFLFHIQCYKCENKVIT